jgi:hypothetical protein
MCSFMNKKVTGFSAGIHILLTSIGFSSK